MPEDKAAEWQREIDKWQAIAKKIHQEEMEARKKPDDWQPVAPGSPNDFTDPRYKPYGV